MKEKHPNTCDLIVRFLDKNDYNFVVIFAGIKTPKQEHVIVEELRIQNEELRSHIMKLLQENQEQAMQLASLRSRHEQLTKIAGQCIKYDMAL